ncbi:MAG: FeoA family protein [Candidatus Micrarchaeota archaeon]
MAVRPLTTLDEGETGKIVELRAGWRFAQRMTELGFDKGSEIRIVSRGAPGPFVVEIKGCGRIVIGWREAQKIIVEKGD